jgi:hypothetical protein
MLDLSNIPSQQQNTTILYATGNWQAWSKPRNAKFIEIFCLGGGAGGGMASVTTGATSSGSGGGSGGIVRGLIPAFLLPDTIYILVGRGGIGATASNLGGGAAGISYVALQPSTSEQTLICKSSTAPALANTAASISVVALSAFGNLGLFTAIAGVAGSTGGLSQTALNTNLTTGGASSGSKSSTTFNVGGNINPATAILTSTVLGGQSSGQNGDNGYGTLKPFCGTGGAGGAGRSGSTGVGGNGGNGYYGCGGGAAGGSSVLGARGGNGGDGLVIITVIC